MRSINKINILKRTFFTEFPKPLTESKPKKQLSRRNIRRQQSVECNAVLVEYISEWYYESNLRGRFFLSNLVEVHQDLWGRYLDLNSKFNWLHNHIPTCKFLDVASRTQYKHKYFFIFRLITGFHRFSIMN